MLAVPRVAQPERVGDNAVRCKGAGARGRGYAWRRSLGRVTMPEFSIARRAASAR